MKFPVLRLLVLVLVVSQGCKKTDVKGNNTSTKDTTANTTNPPPVIVNIPSANYSLSDLGKVTLFNDVPVVVNLANQSHDELSGLAASRLNPGIIYTHEDSGNGPEVYVTNANGDDLGKLILDGVYNRDWEDIACGPGPDDTKKYVYVAEIGDNDAVYKSIFIYRFVEPDLTGANAQTVKHVVPDFIQCVYPTGPVNSETLMVDPLTKDIYIATKQTGESSLYVARYPQSVSSVITLTPLAKFPFDHLTAGDISPDGSEILIRNTGQIWYWKRQSGEAVVDAMLRKPMDAPYAQNEHQGESICFAVDGAGYFTTSETKKYPGDKVALSFYKRK